MVSLRRRHTGHVLALLSLALLLAMAAGTDARAAQARPASQAMPADRSFQSSMMPSRPAASPTLSSVASPGRATTSAQWVATNLAQGTIGTIVVDPQNPRVLYGADAEGTTADILHRTSDGGASWTDFYDQSVDAFAIHPTNAAMLYLAHGRDIFKTVNNGQIWVPTGCCLQNAFYDTIAIDPVNPNTVYAGGLYPVAAGSPGVYKTTNGGASWTQTLANHSIVAIAIDPGAPHVLYAGTDTFQDTLATAPVVGGVLRSADAGVNWTRVLTSTKVNTVVLDPLNTQIVYAATEGDGVWKSVNAGATWSRANTGLAYPIVRALVIAPKNPDVLYAGTWEGGVFRTVDGGASWQSINTGLANTYVRALAIAPTDPPTVYAGTQGSGVYALTSSSTAVSTIAGHVRDAKHVPIAGVVVSDSAGHTATTDASGAYTLGAVPAGSYTLTPTKRGYSFTPTTRAVNVPPNQLAQDFTGAGVSSVWTFMLYLDGDNNLDSSLRQAVRDLEAQPTNPNVRIVVQFDGDEARDSRRFLVQPGGKYTKGLNSWDIPEVNMGHPQSLSDFIIWSRATYPAQHYYLAIADHGRGTDGVAWDDTSKHDYLTNADLRAALDTATDAGQSKIDVLHYDTCLMAMLEVAYQVQDTVSYVVASENLAWSVFDYAGYARANPPAGVTSQTTPRQLAINIAHRYFNNPSIKRYPRTIAAFDENQGAALRRALDRLATALRANIGTFKTQLGNVRTATQKFDSQDYHRITDDDEYLDLYDLAARLQLSVNHTPIQQAAADVQQAITRFVVAEQHQSGKSGGSAEEIKLDGAHGVAIYFPAGPRAHDYRPYIKHQLFQFTRDSQWDEFLADYFRVLELPADVDPLPDPGIPPMLAAQAVYLPAVTR